MLDILQAPILRNVHKTITVLIPTAKPAQYLTMIIVKFAKLASILHQIELNALMLRRETSPKLRIVLLTALLIRINASNAMRDILQVPISRHVNKVTVLTSTVQPVQRLTMLIAKFANQEKLHLLIGHNALTATFLIVQFVAKANQILVTNAILITLHLLIKLFVVKLA